MADYPGYDKLREITQGDDYDVDVFYNRVPDGQRIASATLTIKNNPSDPDNQALYFAPITVTADGDGNAILDDGSTPGADGFGTVHAHWTLLASLTVTFTAGKELFYGVQMRSSAGRVHEPEHGVIRAIQQSVQSTS